MLRIAVVGFVQGFMFVLGERVALLAVNQVRDRIAERTRQWPPYWLLQ